MNELPILDDDWVLAQRPARNPVDPWRPYAYFVEPERTREGVVEPVATLFLTNRECPFRCLMCDLWKNTLEERTPAGAIPAQIAHALEQLPAAPHVKLYNAGNFFDAQAVPPADLPRIAELMRPFRTVIIENHPRLIDGRCLRFRDQLSGSLQVAMGLETVHPEVLPRLNKRMTLEDFEGACNFLTGNGVAVRAFLLLRPPFLDEEAGVQWAKKSIVYAFDVGVECCVVIPTRAGNGAMEQLEARGLFQPPRLSSLEEVLAFGIALQRGRVFADLWDVAKLADCLRCTPARVQRLARMNYTQEVEAPVACDCVRHA